VERVNARHVEGGNGSMVVVLVVRDVANRVVDNVGPACAEAIVVIARVVFARRARSALDCVAVSFTVAPNTTSHTAWQLALVAPLLPRWVLR
jgi:hypothetical protein